MLELDPVSRDYETPVTFCACGFHFFPDSGQFTRGVSDQEPGSSGNKGAPKEEHVFIIHNVHSSFSSETSTIYQKKKNWNHSINFIYLNGMPTRIIRSAKWRRGRGRNSGSSLVSTFGLTLVQHLLQNNFKEKHNTISTQKVKNTIRHWRTFKIAKNFN